MKFLNKNIAEKVKYQQTKSLVQKKVSCGIFQEMGTTFQNKVSNKRLQQ